MSRKLFWATLTAVTLQFAAPVQGIAQGAIAPVITINESAVTRYEINQRVALLDLFGTSGNLQQLAREGLIDDRLKQQELARNGVSLSVEELAQALEDFAQRANLTTPEMNTLLRQNGIHPDTLRDFVSIGVMWRDFVRARFGGSVTVTDADVDQAIAARESAPTELEVLLSEIVIAPPPNMLERARAIAQQISQVRNYNDFSDAARQVSALSSRENGGRLGWKPISDYPPQIASVLLSLRPTEVTEPIDIPGGIALFQMRGIREGRPTSARAGVIDYAIYYIPVSEGGAQQARRIRDRVDTCDDLYGVARNQPAERLERRSERSSAIDADISRALETLDPNEVSTALTTPDGENVLFVMLCSRQAEERAEANTEAVRVQITSQRLATLADALLADLRATAVISGQ